MFLGRIGSMGVILVKVASTIFNPLLTTLSDAYGNVAEAISVAGRTVKQYDGTIVSVPPTLHSFAGARLGTPITWTSTSTVTTTATTIEKTSGTVGWDAQAYSAESFTGSAYLRFKVGQTTTYGMIALNATQVTDVGYTKLDFALYPQVLSDVQIYESGVFVGTLGAYTTSNVFEIVYSGTTVEYKIDGVVVHTTTVAAGMTMYLDSSLYSVNHKFTDIIFNATPDVYHNTDTTGNPLHPTQQFMGGTVPKFVPAYATGQIIPAGGSRFDAGKWYTSALGGTTSGATLLTDTGVTDWVERGLYQSPYGILVEGAGTNRCTYSEDLTAGSVTKTGVTINANAFTAPDGATTMDGVVEDGVSTGYHVYWHPAVITAGSQVSASVYISKTGRRYWQVGCGSFLESFGCVVDTLTGTVTATGTSGAGHIVHDAYVEDIGVAWRVVIYGTLSYPTPFVTVQATDVSTYIGVTPSVTPATNVTGIWGAQQEMGLPTSYMKSVATNGTRADSMGAIKWSTAAPAFGGNGFPHALGNVLVAWQPQFNSGDLAAADRVIVATNNAVSLLAQQIATVTNITSTDGTSSEIVTLPAYNHNDAILLNVRFGLGADPTQPAAQRLQLCYANVTQGDTAFTIVASVPYDGAFTDTGFLQLLKALGGNNSVFGNSTVHDTPATDADLAGLL